MRQRAAHANGSGDLRNHGEATSDCARRIARNGSARGHDRGYDAGDAHLGVLPRIRRLIQASRPHLRSEADVLKQAAHVATADRELLYTTFQMDKARFQLVMLTQWMGNLRGRAANALLVGTDAATCHVVRNASMPCWWTRRRRSCAASRTPSATRCSSSGGTRRCSRPAATA